ncbi:MAG: shikimate kinase [Bacteroidales bacterium]
MRYFLIGFMGSGKSSLGYQLAKILNIDFFDLDQYIEQSTQKSIQAIFETEGEQPFRNYETKYLNQIISLSDNAVISTGGGTPCFNNNINIMLKNGIVIYLKNNPTTLAKRIFLSKTIRPLVKNMNESELSLWIEEKLKEREVFYNQANLIIEAQNISATQLKNYIEHFYTKH